MTGSGDTAAGVDALVSGKRLVPRVRVRLPVLVRGVHGDFEGCVDDLSMGGAFLRVPMSVIPGVPKEPLGPVEQFALLERHFRDSFDLLFTGRDIIVEAQVVRLLVGADDPREAELSLGCKFVSPLSTRQQDALGLLDNGSEYEAWGDALVRHGVRWVSDPSRPVAAFLLHERSGVAGPAYVGAVRALGKAAFTVRLGGVTRREVRASTGEAPVRARILRGARELLAVDVELVALRYCDYPAPGVEGLFAARAPLPRAVRKHFRRT